MVIFISFCWKACFVVGKCEKMNLGQKKVKCCGWFTFTSRNWRSFHLEELFFQKVTDQGSVEMWGAHSPKNTGVFEVLGRFPPETSNHNMFLQNGSVSTAAVLG